MVRVSDLAIRMFNSVNPKDQICNMAYLHSFDCSGQKTCWKTEQKPEMMKVWGLRERGCERKEEIQYEYWLLVSFNNFG